MVFPLEKPAGGLPGFAELSRHTDRHIIANAVVGFLFAVTGPLAIMIAVARGGGLTGEDIASWVFAAYGLAGILTIVVSALYRQPSPMAWTIPGLLLLPAAFDHLSFAEIVGAYLASGALMTVLALSGGVAWIMARIPLAIVMGMVAGVFLPFGLNIITAFGQEFTVSLVTVVAFLVFSLAPRLARIFPPVLGALVVGFVVVWLGGGFDPGALSETVLVRPRLYAPEFSPRALAELVVPLSLTVIAIQNGQGITILKSAGFKPPINVLTLACGLGTIVFGLFGSVPACVTGPSNAMINSSGRLEDRYVGGIAFGVLMLLMGLFAPLAIGFALALPTAFIALLGGLAMLRVLQSAFQAAFGGGFSLGALVAFLVTVSDATIFNVGAAFWGIVFGFAASWLFERGDFAALEREL